jgi:hypothetical protein
MDWQKLRPSSNVEDDRNVQVRNDPGMGGTTKSRPAGESDFSVARAGSYQGEDHDAAVRTTYKADERAALEEKVRSSEKRSYSSAQKNKMDELVRRKK